MNRVRDIRRLRNEVGQTAAEYVGIIVVIGAVIGAVATADIGTAISSKITQAITGMKGGGREAARREGPPGVRRPRGPVSPLSRRAGPEPLGRAQPPRTLTHRGTPTGGGFDAGACARRPCVDAPPRSGSEEAFRRAGRGQRTSGKGDRPTYSVGLAARAGLWAAKRLAARPPLMSLLGTFSRPSRLKRYRKNPDRLFDRGALKSTHPRRHGRNRPVYKIRP